MTLFKSSHGRYLNMELLVDAEIVPVEGSTGVLLAILRFAAPWEQVVYADGEIEGGESIVVPYEVCLRGDRASAVHRWLDSHSLPDGPWDSVFQDLIRAQGTEEGGAT